MLSENKSSIAKFFVLAQLFKVFSLSAAFLKG